MNLLKPHKNINFFQICYYLLTCLNIIAIHSEENQPNEKTTETKKVTEIYFVASLPEIVDYNDFLPPETNEKDETNILPINKEKILALIDSMKDGRMVVMYGYGDYKTTEEASREKESLLLIGKKSNDDEKNIPSRAQYRATVDLGPYTPGKSTNNIIVFSGKVEQSMLNSAESKLNSKLLKNMKVGRKPGFFLRKLKEKVAQKLNQPEIKIGQKNENSRLILRNNEYKNAAKENPSLNTYFKQSKNAYKQHVGWTYMKLAFSDNRDSLQEGVEVYIPFSKKESQVYLLIRITQGNTLSELKQNISPNNARKENVTKPFTNTKKIGEIHIGIDRFKSNGREDKKINLTRIDPDGIFTNENSVYSSVNQVVEHIKKKCLELDLQIKDHSNDNDPQAGYKFFIRSYSYKQEKVKKKEKIKVKEKKKIKEETEPTEKEKIKESIEKSEEREAKETEEEKKREERVKKIEDSADVVSDENLISHEIKDSSEYNSDESPDELDTEKNEIKDIKIEILDDVQEGKTRVSSMKKNIEKKKFVSKNQLDTDPNKKSVYSYSYILNEKSSYRTIISLVTLISGVYLGRKIKQKNQEKKK